MVGSSFSHGARDTSPARCSCTGKQPTAGFDRIEGGPTYVDNRPLLVANKPEPPEYIPTRGDFVGDVALSRHSQTKAEVSQLTDEITVDLRSAGVSCAGSQVSLRPQQKPRT